MPPSFNSGIDYRYDQMMSELCNLSYKQRQKLPRVMQVEIARYEQKHYSGKRKQKK